MLKHASRVVGSRTTPVATQSSRPVAKALSHRTLHTTRPLRRTEDEEEPIPQEQGGHVGTHSRTDNRIEIPFEEGAEPQQKPVQGRGAFRKCTLFTEKQQSTQLTRSQQTLREHLHPSPWRTRLHLSLVAPEDLVWSCHRHWSSVVLM